ncbi:MAG: hypothetical protein M1819_004773 [Sarea resinae]|nr:MAG: hypothetical protein M1819_004773 [Sarea resinae]
MCVAWGDDTTLRRYPHSFREGTIRAVSPDSISIAEEIHSRDPSMDGGFSVSDPSTSPRNGKRGSSSLQSSDFLSHSSSNGSRYSNNASKNMFVRPRTRTMDEKASERSSAPFVQSARHRINSVHSSASSLYAGVDDSTPSKPHGPNISPSPSSASHTSSSVRNRLVKQPPRASSPLSHSGSLTSPVAIADANKMLRLMKATRGRMRGIVAFRRDRNAAWSWGYCFIDEEAGSLIHDPKDVRLCKGTLIADLRGCQIKTGFDTQSQCTYLDIFTLHRGWELQIRPSMPEECDNWLAALLCWQPIHPKGAQNKMHKVRKSIISERRPEDGRRNSEVKLQKDAAIIKLGGMSFWDKVRPSETSSRRGTPRRPSATKTQAPGHAWRRVSACLQENGEFRLFSEADSSLLCVVQLSQLSRCAVQRLHPSVLEDEFSIAIYPQYTSTSTTLSLIRPIYVSMETRVLFEVWFVLLRAFTIPELYGPGQPELGDDMASSQTMRDLFATPTTDMFRIERSLSLRILEAKLQPPKPLVSLERNASHHSNNKESGAARANSGVGNYYTEVFLDGEIRAKTTVQHNTNHPFWREEFELLDSPAVLSSISVLLKRVASESDTGELRTEDFGRLVGENFDSSTDLDDYERHSFDVPCGKVSLYLDELERKDETEKWWPITDKNGDSIGQIYMKIRAEELVILMSQDYKPMSELLQKFSRSLTLRIAQSIPKELLRLSEILLNIFQVAGNTNEWLMSLIEEEIDGIHKAAPSNRVRFSARIGSNDPFDTNGEREIVLRDMGRSAMVEANLLFRGNSLLTKALDLQMKRVGKEYLEETLGERLGRFSNNDLDLEVDPNRIEDKRELDKHWQKLISKTKDVWDAISASASRCPPELRILFRHIRACAEDRYGGFSRTVSYSSVSGFLFLRFFCPAVLNPKLFGLLKEHPRPKTQRTLTLIAKSLQGLANMSSFGVKEPWMKPMNDFLSANRQSFKDFIDDICSVSSDPYSAISPMPPSYATPITILTRLPGTSREGFLSLPYLIDHARNFAALVKLWLDAYEEVAISNPSPSGGGGDTASQRPPLEGDLLTFHEICRDLNRRAKVCLSQAEQAERPSSAMSAQWEEVVERLEGASIAPTTPSAVNSNSIDYLLDKRNGLVMEGDEWERVSFTDTETRDSRDELEVEVTEAESEGGTSERSSSRATKDSRKGKFRVRGFRRKVKEGSKERDALKQREKEKEKEKRKEERDRERERPNAKDKDKDKDKDREREREREDRQASVSRLLLQDSKSERERAVSRGGDGR